MSAARAAFEALFDYAGLFPPANLSLEAAVGEFARRRAAAEAWTLGRFVIPAGRLDELAALPAASGQPGVGASWPLAVLLPAGDRVTADVAAVEAFARAWPGRFDLRAVEVAVSSPSRVASMAAALPPSVERFLEIPAEPDPAPFVAAVAAAGVRAKIRTGGLTLDAFPSARQLARFIERCLAAGVAFKATAGLHHAVRGAYSFTEEPGSACGAMHGFVNLVMAATLRWAGRIDEAGATRVLEDADGARFWFEGDRAGWGEASVAATELAQARRELFRAIGTCSVAEVATSLRA